MDSSGLFGSTTYLKSSVGKGITLNDKFESDKIKILAPTKRNYMINASELELINNLINDKKYDLIRKKNEKIILKVFYKELTKQSFSLTVSDAEGLHKISSFENIIELYENLDEMIIIVRLILFLILDVLVFIVSIIMILFLSVLLRKQIN